MDDFRLNQDIAEFCGTIMGDGNLWSNNRKYEITITGNKIDDKEYFEYLYSFIDKNIKKNPYYRIRGGIRLTIYSKKFYIFVNKDIGIPDRKLKRKSGIPLVIKQNELFIRRFIRGIFDTDGTVFTSDKPGSPNYPTLEISNSNLAMIRDIQYYLDKLGFRVHLRKTPKAEYKLSMYGKNMLKKWKNLIDSSNPYKRKRIEYILEHFC